MVLRTLKRWARKDDIIKLLNDLVKVAKSSSIRAQGKGVSVRQGPNGTTISIRNNSGTGAGSVVRAITQEATITADGLLSVKFLDEDDDSAVGDAFDIFINADQSTIDLTKFLPVYASGAKIKIVKIGGEYYFLENLVEFIPVTVITDVRVNGTTLQEKHTELTILATGAESAWTTYHTGTDCT